MLQLKKKEISRAILDNSNNLKKIIKVVHPIVRKKMNSFIKKNKNKKIVVFDVPLLLENKIYNNSMIVIKSDHGKTNYVELSYKTNFLQ